MKNLIREKTLETQEIFGILCSNRNLLKCCSKGFSNFKKINSV